MDFLVAEGGETSMSEVTRDPKDEPKEGEEPEEGEEGEETEEGEKPAEGQPA